MTPSTDDALPLGRPLTDAEYWNIRGILEKTYIGRPSDHTVRNSLEMYLAARERWEADRELLHAMGKPTESTPDWNESGNQEEDDDESFDEQSEEVDFELRGIIVSGASGAGKTRLVNRALQQVGLRSRRKTNTLPLIAVKLPGSCTLLTLGRAILRKTGYPVAGMLKEHVVWELVSKRLAQEQVKAIHLDEIQHITKKANIKEATRILDTLKSLSTSPEHPVILVLSGTRDFVAFAEKDEQVQRRFDFVPLESFDMQDAEAVVNALRKLTAQVKLGLEDGFEAELVPRLIHAGAKQVGRTMELAVHATLRALRPTTKAGCPLPPETVLTMGHFAAEYAKRSGNRPFANVFVAPNWHLLDVSKVGIVSPSQIHLAQESPIDEPTPKSPKKKKGSA